jgi:hypothetical protein
MNADRWDDTLAAYLDDRTGVDVELTPEQTEELLDLVEFDGLLRHRSRPRQTDVFQKAVDRRIEAETTKSGFVRRVDVGLRRRSLKKWGIAAAAAVIVGAWLWLGGSPDGPRLAVVTGGAEVRRPNEAEWRAVSDSMDVYPGDALRTSKGTARILYDSGSVVSVKPATALTLSPPGLTMTQGDVAVVTARADRG